MYAAALKTQSGRSRSRLARTRVRIRDIQVATREPLHAGRLWRHFGSARPTRPSAPVMTTFTAGSPSPVEAPAAASAWHDRMGCKRQAREATRMPTAGSFQRMARSDSWIVVTRALVDEIRDIAQHQEAVEQNPAAPTAKAPVGGRETHARPAPKVRRGCAAHRPATSKTSPDVTRTSLPCTRASLEMQALHASRRTERLAGCACYELVVDSSPSANRLRCQVSRKAALVAMHPRLDQHDVAQCRRQEFHLPDPSASMRSRYSP